MIDRPIRKATTGLSGPTQASGAQQHKYGSGADLAWWIVAGGKSSNVVEGDGKALIVVVVAVVALDISGGKRKGGKASDEIGILARRPPPG